MSLINQMLKDLERRQASPVNPPGTRLPTGGAPSKRFSRARGLFLVAGVFVAVALGWWGIVAFRESRSVAEVPIRVTEEIPARNKVPVRDTAQEPAPEPETPTASAIVEEPAAVERPSSQSVVEPTPVEQPAVSVVPPATAAKDTVKAAPKPEPTPKTVTRPASSAGTLKKTPRPLSPEEKSRVALAKGEDALKNGQVAGAEAAFREALRMMPGSKEAREALAGLLLASGRISEAVPLYREGLDLAPDYAPFRKGYARILVDQGEVRTAAAVLEAAPLPSVDADPEYHLLLAAVFQRLGRYAEAAEAYGRVLQIQPGNGLTWMGMAIALESDGRPREALDAYRQSLARGNLRSDLVAYVQGRIAALER